MSLAARIPILVFEAAGFFFGADANTVTAIGASDEIGHVVLQDVMSIFSKSLDDRPRVLMLQGGTIQRGFMVDEIHGVHYRPPSGVAALPESLCAFVNPPKWFVGTMSHEENLVWLVDLHGALEAGSGRAI